jgi:chemotaxis signal transduction protein
MQSGSYENREPAVAVAEHGTINGAAETWVLFSVDEQKYGLLIWEVERIVRAVEVKPLPESPPHICGIVNVQGRVLPVVDLRVRFGLPTRDIRLEDHFIIATTDSLSVVLPADAALGSVEVAGGSEPTQTETRSECIRKVVTLDDGEAVYGLDLHRVLYTGKTSSESELPSVLTELQTA